MARLPKALVFDLDGCCWDPEMYELWGGGSPFKENKDGTLSDKRGTKVHLLGDVKDILHELHTDPKWKDSIAAIASTCDEPKWARECLKKFSIAPGVAMEEVFRPDCCEIYKAYGKNEHINAIAKKTGIDIKDMIFFDNQTNNTSCVAGMNGPTVVYTPDGVTRALFEPREEYLEWSEYFMAVSFLSAMRSKDPATQVGACIVSDDKRIVGIGYNGFPRGCPDDKLPWGKTSNNELDTKYMYVCHAEMNAIMNKNSASVEGCTMYVALFPCNECAKMIIQAGIKEVIYYSDKHAEKKSTIASKRLLDMAGIPFKQFVPKMKKIVIDFESADR